MASAASSVFDVTPISYDPPFSRSQQNVIVKNVFSDVPLPARCYESWLPNDVFKREFARQQRKELVRKMVQYHQENYEIPTGRFYLLDDNIINYSEFMDEWMR